MGGVEDGDYLSVTPAGGSNDGVVAIESTMNITPSDRAMVISLSGDRGVEASVSVSQPSGYQAEKTVTVTENGMTEVLPDDGKLAMGKVVVDVNVSTSGGGGGGVVPDEEGVFFYDYNGDLLYSYSVAEARALTELPVVPTTHEYLTPDGWTHTLDQVQEVDRLLFVGALYSLIDASLIFKVEIPVGGMSVHLPCYGSVSISWGDGTGVMSGGNGASPHTYSRAGLYVVKCKGSIKQVYASSNTPVNTVIKEAFVGLPFTGSLPLGSCKALERVVIARGVTGPVSFQGAFNLRACVCPPTLTRLPYFEDCHNLTRVVFGEGPSEAYSSYIFRGTALSRLLLPNSITTLSSYALSGASGLGDFRIPSGVLTLPKNLFSGSTSLTKLTIPVGITILPGSLCYNCSELREVICEGSITAIQSYAFYGCLSLQTFPFSSLLTEVGASAFNNCYALREVLYLSAVKPTSL